MSNQGRNDGFRVLDDFVCEAIHDPSISRADEQHRGENEGMLVVEELSFEASGKARPDEMESSGGNGSSRSAALNDAIKSEAGRIAAIIAAAANPFGAVALFQKLLFAELDTIRTSVASTPQRSRADNRSKPEREKNVEPGAAGDQPHE